MVIFFFILFILLFSIIITTTTTLSTGYRHSCKSSQNDFFVPTNCAEAALLYIIDVLKIMVMMQLALRPRY